MEVSEKRAVGEGQHGCEGPGAASGPHSGYVGILPTGCGSQASSVMCWRQVPGCTGPRNKLPDASL